MGNATTKFQSKKKKNRTEPKREPQDRKLEKNENFKTVHKELRKKHKETNQFCEVTNDINVQLEKYSQITKKNSEGEEVIVKSIKKKQNVDYETETRLIELYKMPASAVPVNEIFQNISQFNKSKFLFYLLLFYYPLDSFCHIIFTVGTNISLTI